MKKQLREFIVPWVWEAAPYSDKHMDFAWSHPNITRMMSNENPLPPSEKVLQAIAEAARLGNLYPGSGEELRGKLGEAAGLSADNVLLGNGSTDIINILINTFIAPQDEAVVPFPTFSMYEARLRVNGGIPIGIQISSPPDFYWDIEGIIKTVTQKTKLIFICTPNNPTGNQIRLADLLRILELGIPTLIDEAYYELEDDPHSLAYLIEEYPHAIIGRTMSKAFGLAGLRLGYAFASEELVSVMNRVRIPWNVSLLAIAGALAALEELEDQRNKRETILTGRRYLYQEINQIPGLRAFPSEGNFMLIDATSLKKSSAQIREDFIERGIFIRPMSFHHMEEGFMRVTIGTLEQNRHFVEVLRAYVAASIEPFTTFQV
jgi:histidinol-phosphate aminotransferase